MVAEILLNSIIKVATKANIVFMKEIWLLTKAMHFAFHAFFYTFDSGQR